MPLDWELPHKIFKYPLKLQDEQLIEMQQWADILSVKNIGDELYLWAMVAVDAPKEERKIMITGTGHPIDPEILIGGKHIDTVVMPNGLVWHIFEVK